MKKLIISMLLTLYSNFLFGQTGVNSHEPGDLYDSFLLSFKAASKNKGDIILNVQEFYCLGGIGLWSVVMKMERGGYRINFFYDKGNDQMIDYTSWIKKPEPDTSYLISERAFLHGLKQEMEDIKKRPVLLESNYKFALKQGGSSKELSFQRGEGLYNLFRYNKLLSRSKIAK